MKKRVMCILMAVVMLFCCCACTSNPKRVVKRLETAINQRDKDAVVDCFDSSIQAAYKAIDFFDTTFLKGKLKDILRVAGSVAQLIDLDDVNVKLVVNSKEKISDVKYKLDVTAYCTYTDRRSEPFELQMSIYVVYENGDWYITTG